MVVECDCGSPVKATRQIQGFAAFCPECYVGPDSVHAHGATIEEALQNWLESYENTFGETPAERAARHEDELTFALAVDLPFENDVWTPPERLTPVKGGPLFTRIWELAQSADLAYRCRMEHR